MSEGDDGDDASADGDSGDGVSGTSLRPPMRKAGARHSKTDRALLQKAHNVMAALGAACMKDEGDEPDDSGDDVEMGLRLTLADDEPLVLALADSDPTLLEFDDAALRHSLADAVRTGLAEQVNTAVAAALARARGRVD